VSLAERVLRGILQGDPGTRAGRARLKAAIEARRLLLRFGDPVVRYRIDGVELQLPLSHELPFYRNDHPEYGVAVARIAAELGGPVVDVGANVGDTAAAIRARSDVAVLCIEGDERFFALLEQNATAFEPVELERAFVEGPGHGRIERAAGTARLAAGKDVLPSKPLALILDEHPRFARPSLLKLDTDGMDVPILLANVELLARLEPVLFFEYDPHLGADPVVFERLREIGYERMHVYENTGEHAATVELPGAIHDDYVGHGGRRYADVCALPRGMTVGP
jgi:FkbM family methyltransferase